VTSEIFFDIDKKDGLDAWFDDIRVEPLER